MSLFSFFNKKSPIPQDLVPAFDYPKVKQSFLNEMLDASQGKQTSIPYIINSLPEKPLAVEGIIQGIVMGGTNYIVSTAQIQNGSIAFLDKKTGELPILKDKATVIAFLKEHLDSRAQAVGLNFGFPLTPIKGKNGELDGQLIKGTKEHLFEGVVGMTLGDIVREAAERDVTAAVANDTICLMLAGDGSEDGSIIAGTGFNIGIRLDPRTAVNLEAANFNKFVPTEALRIIDERSDMPGTNLFEKLISGKYLSELFNVKAEKLGITFTPIHTSQELSALSHETKNETANLLARALLERSAYLVAASISAVYEFRMKKPLTIIGEGSLLWKGWNYKVNIERELENLNVPPLAITFKHIQDSSIQGALGLLTK